MWHTSSHHGSESMAWLQRVYLWLHRCRFCLFWSHTYLIDFYCGRRGEEHSFILKPAALLGRDIKAYGERSSQASQVAIGASNLPLISRIGEVISTSGDQYAVLVSCRCNYTGMLLREIILLPFIHGYWNFLLNSLPYAESKLFFKQATSWRPRATRDLLISVASEMSKQSFGPYRGISQLPVQVLHFFHECFFFFNHQNLLGYCNLRCLADIHIELDLGWTVQNICQCGPCVWDLSNSYGYTYFEHATSPWPRNILLRPSCYVCMDQVLMFFIYFYCLQSSFG